MAETVGQVLVSTHLRQKLHKTIIEVGYIVGWQEEKTWTCVECATNLDYFLHGLEHIGYFIYLDDLPPEENSKIAVLCKEQLVKDYEVLDYDDNLVLIVYPTFEGFTRETMIKAVLFSSYYCTVKDVPLSVVNSVHSNVSLFRARGQLPLIFEGSSDEDLQKENLEFAMGKLKTIFRSDIPVFHSENLHTTLKNTSTENNLQCRDLVKQLEEEGLLEKRKKKNKNISEEKVPITFDILLQTTGQVAIENNVNHSLVIHCQRREFLCVSMSLPIDVLVVAQGALPLSELYKLLIEAIVFQLDRFMQCLLDHHKGSQFPTPEVYHFYPFEWDFPITLVYPAESSDNELGKYRMNIMNDLLLPLDRPFFRKTNRYFFPGESTSSGHLINPHVGLPPSGVQGGTTAVVWGRYAYHHYMQDHMNDDGWGCAYRSLQTIVSWFRLQGYTDRPIPTHKEIQQVLVEIGDKPASFMGTKQWIGSQEVSFCLDHLIKIGSRIMFVNSGADLANKGRELLQHFQDNGTPIMIGGGVLAHTILGVDYSENTGELKFLVLDPHYTGSEDLSVVQNKGWCGWKSMQFWDHAAFYNMCLPQRPMIT